MEDFDQAAGGGDTAVVDVPDSLAPVRYLELHRKKMLAADWERHRQLTPWCLQHCIDSDIRTLCEAAQRSGLEYADRQSEGQASTR